MKTRILSFLTVFAITAACSDTPEIIDEIANGRAKPPTPEQLFEMNTRHLDKSGEALACNDIYKLLGDSCVVKIDAKLQPSINYGTVIVDSTNRHLIELWVFEKGDASLRNICSDLVVTKEGERPVPPLLRLHPEDGALKLVEEPVAEKRDGMSCIVPVRSVLIKSLTFKDPKGRTIVLEDELIWKVRDSGTPG